MPLKSHLHYTGEVVPVTGIYSVYHTEHRLPEEVILVGGDQFPRCSKCPVRVTFAMVRAAKAGFEHHPVRIYELPDLDDEELKADSAGTAG
jgi:hypothetical protein